MIQETLTSDLAYAPTSEIENWHIEKINSTIEPLVSLAANLIRVPSETEEDQENLMWLAFALKNATKLYLNLHGKPSKGTEHELILQKGREGFEELKVLSGLTNGLTLENTVDRIIQFLQEPRSPARTLIHEALEESVSTHPFIHEAKSLAYKVTMNELPWDDFVSAMQMVIESHGFCDHKKV